MLVKVGNEYAEKLGYTEIVGLMVAPGNALTALVEVQVVLGPAELIGKLYDIHKDDMEPIPEEREETYYFACDYDSEKVFYSKNKELIGFVRRDLHGKNRAVRAYNVTMAEVMEHYNKFTIHLVDEGIDEECAAFLKSWELKQNMERQMEEKKEQEAKSVTAQIPVKESDSPFTAIFEGIHAKMQEDKDVEFKAPGGSIFGPPKFLRRDREKSDDFSEKDSDGFYGGGYED